MKLRLALSALLSLPLLAQAAPSTSPLLVIHGGAGVERKDLSPAEEKAARAALKAALLKGHAELAAGRPALAAVTAAITVLEDDPTFNAGKGAVFTHDGHNELDASLMDGATQAAGAVAGVQRVRNPIQLAQLVMQKSPHVMMVGQGAEAFAVEQGVSLWIPRISAPTSAGSSCSAPSRKRPVARPMPISKPPSISAPSVLSRWMRRAILRQARPLAA